MAGDADAEFLSSDDFLRILRVNDGSDEEEEGIEQPYEVIKQEEGEEGWNREQPPEEEGQAHPGLLQQQEVRLSSIDTALLIRHVPSRGLSFQIWPAAATMVSLLDRDPDLLLPKSLNSPLPRHPLRVLELGSGTGLVGIAAAAALGARVTVTDLPHVVPNLLHNAAANAAAVAARGGEVVARQLRWGDERDAVEAIADAGRGGDDGRSGFDLVLGSDVVYYEHLIDPLLRTLREVVRGDGTAFVMAHLRRWKRRDALFFRKARKVFDVEVLHEDLPLPEWRSGVVVYRFVAKKKKKQEGGRGAAAGPGEFGSDAAGFAL